MKKYLVFILLAALTSFVSGQDEIITLQDEPIEFDADGFYIKKVVDARKNTDDIGFVQKGVFKKTKVDANLKGGVEKAISGYLEENFDQDRNGVPVVIHITELKISETKSYRLPEKQRLRWSFTARKTAASENYTSRKHMLKSRR